MKFPFRPLAALVALLALGAAGPALAADDDSLHTEARLLSSHARVRAGSDFLAGIALRMEPEWHTYWRNSGDSGLPTRVTWELPQGWSAGELRWPVPQRFSEAHLTTYGYSGEVLLMAPVSVPEDAAPGPYELRAEVNWLECKDICIPGKAAVRETVEVGPQAQASPAAELFERFLDEIPKVHPGIEALAERTGDTVRLRLSGEGVAGARLAEFFPLEPYDLKVVQTGPTADGLAVQFDASMKSETLEGVLVLDTPEGTRRAQVNTPLTITAAAASEVEKPAPHAPQKGAAPISLLLALGFAFLGGILLNIMPCVFPVLAVKIIGLLEQTGADRRRVRMHGLAFFAGVLVCFWILTALLLILRGAGNQVGWGFQLQSPGFLLFLILLLTAMSLSLLGAFEIGVMFTGVGAKAASLPGYVGSFYSGLLATVLATPCTAPFMGAALGLTLVRPPAETVLIFTLLGAGMAAPYTLLCFFPAWARALPKPGAWMARFRQAMSFPLLLTVVWLVWVLGHHLSVDQLAMVWVALVILGLAGWVYGMWQVSRRGIAGMIAALLAVAAVGLGVRAVAHPQTAAESAVRAGWEAYSPEAVRRAVDQGQPAFIDFTAAWCLTCQVNARVLHDPGVAAAFNQRGVALFEADWTLRDETITQALASFGRRSVPLYVFYPGDGEPILLPELLRREDVFKALEKLD